MKTTLLISCMILFTSFGQIQAQKPLQSDFECVLTTSKTVYSVDEVPDLQVSIVNKGKEDVYFIRALDGSEKVRMPYCYFKIENLQKDSLHPNGRCGNIGNLNKEDFILVKTGDSFNPYFDNGHHLFRAVREGMFRGKAYKRSGKYKITFHYSTNSDSILDYLGLSQMIEEVEKMGKLFSQVPKIELQSNTIEIEIVE